ncbi:hypothetical protein PAXRUDRAFT_55204, partial [Paxillus rubicundulus Ve08.2h10]
MHAGVRRMPAERARHAKRLGHVQNPGPFPILAGHDNKNPATTPTLDIIIPLPQSTNPSSAAAKQTSSSALSSAALTPVLSPSPSPSTTSALTSLAASSTPLHSPTTSTPSAPLVSQHPSTSVVVPSTLPTSSTPQTNAAAPTSSGLSGGAIAGIIAAGIIAGVALIVFFIRKTYLRRRERKHASWTGVPGLGRGSMFDEPKPNPEFSDKPPSVTGIGGAPQRGSPMSPFEARGQSMYSTPPPPDIRPQSPYVSYAAPAPPQATYNNPVSITSYSTQPTTPTL